MSVRIHELAKRIGMDNKELLALLKGRGFDVKTVSSTVDPISAEALESELKAQQAAAAPAPAAPVPEAVPEVPAPAAPAFATKVPQGVFVRSAADIAQEKADVEKAKQAARVVAAPPPPVVPARPAHPTGNAGPADNVRRR